MWSKKFGCFEKVQREKNWFNIRLNFAKNWIIMRFGQWDVCYDRNMRITDDESINNVEYMRTHAAMECGHRIQY